MAGMFYSLEEASEKLGITQEQLKEVISQGKLREFRDGENVLLKVDEVEALTGEIAAAAGQEAPSPPEGEAEGDEFEGELELAEGMDSGGEPGAATSELLKAITEEPDAGAEQSYTSDELAEAERELDLSDKTGELADTAGELAEVESDLAEAEDALADTANQLSDTENTLADTASQLYDTESALADTGSELDEAAFELPEQTAGDDTEQIGVLGETETEFRLPDETVVESAKGAGEESLEQIEESVNLDSFGSGSGLLDLSLQADDTSLGGILDEIYTPGGTEDQDRDAAEPGSVMDVAAEADQMLTEQDFTAAPTPTITGPGIVRAFPEAAPDALSNAFGIMLFLPLLAIIYATIVALAGLVGAIPAILTGIKGMILYVTIGLLVASLLVLGVGFMLSRPGGRAGARPKVRKPKPKKAKKVPKAGK